MIYRRSDVISVYMKWKNVICFVGQHPTCDLSDPQRVNDSTVVKCLRLPNSQFLFPPRQKSLVSWAENTQQSRAALIHTSPHRGIVLKTWVIRSCCGESRCGTELTELCWGVIRATCLWRNISTGGVVGLFEFGLSPRTVMSCGKHREGESQRQWRSDWGFVKFSSFRNSCYRNTKQKIDE